MDYLIRNFGFICVSGSKFGYEKISIRISCIDIDLEKLDLTIDQYGKNIIDGLDILINFLQNKIDN